MHMDVRACALARSPLLLHARAPLDAGGERLPSGATGVAPERCDRGLGDSRHVPHQDRASPGWRALPRLSERA